MWNPAGRVGPAVLSAALLACASGHTKQPNTDETPLPVNLEVQNDLSVPEPLTIYVQSLPGRPRMLGDMGPGTVKTFSFTPAQFGEPYRLIGYQQLMRPFTSAEFTIDGPETGTVIWSVRSGIISLLAGNSCRVRIQFGRGRFVSCFAADWHRLWGDRC